MTAIVLLPLEMSMPTEFICIPPTRICNRNPSFSHCRFNLLGDANSKAQPAQIERCNKGMADSLCYGHRSPRRHWSASCSPYCSLGMRWKESRTGCPAFLSKFIVIGGISMFGTQKKKEIDSLAYTRWNCKYHIVFAPKYRRQAIYGQIRTDIGSILS